MSKRTNIEVIAERIEAELRKGARKDDNKHPPQAQWLIEYARGNAKLWTTPDGEAYITTARHQHYPVRSEPTRRWLRRAFYAQHGKPPGSQAVQDAITMLEVIADAEGETHPIHTRVAQLGDCVYLDLGDEDWRAVEITRDGWGVVRNCPVRFRRAKGMQALPAPIPGGGLDELRNLLPPVDRDTWILLVAWVLACLSPRGPYPVLILQGEQGSGKSTTARMLRGLVDPNTAPLRAVPREERDLFIAAKNGWVICFDNLSGAPVWLSDALCRLATGGGWGTRALYTDADEVLIEVQRPVLLNGIDDIATRDDLRDRAIIVTLPPLPDRARRDECTLWRQYEAVRPRVLGALLDAVSIALKRQDEISLENPPRMADFAKWVVAAEEALWEPGAFLEAYTQARHEAAATSLESNQVAQAVLEFMRDRLYWEGTASELLRELERLVSDKVLRSKTWPTTARGLAGRLRRVAPLLRHTGVDTDWVREPGSGNRIICLSKKKYANDRHNRHNRHTGA